MSQITVRLDENVTIGLTKLGAAIPRITRRQIERFAEKSRKAISGYYAGGNSYRVPLPQSGRNVRTGRYGSSVTYAFPDFSRAVFQNAAYSPGGFNYGPLLTGDSDGSGQAWWARGRWPIMRQIVDDNVTPFVAEYDADIQAGVEAAGL